MLEAKSVEEIVEKYADMVYRIALTRCGNIENAEDVFQDVFLKYSEKMPNFDSEEHEKAWLIRVTINMTKNMKRLMWNKTTVELDENILFETEEDGEVFSVICSLPQNYRTVIYLFYEEGYKVREISQMMQKSEGTIKTWLFRARDMLKDKLKGGFEDESRWL